MNDYREPPRNLGMSMLDSREKIAEIDDVLLVIEHVLKRWPDACRALCRKIETRQDGWDEIVDAVVAVSHAGTTQERWANLATFIRQQAGV